MSFIQKSILQVHINFFPDDMRCIISVALMDGKDSFYAVYKHCKSVSNSEIVQVTRYGTVLNEKKARELFNLPEYAYSERIDPGKDRPE